MTRTDGRGKYDLRPVKITRNYLKHPEGSVFIEIGDTKVICTASVEDRSPSWMKEQNRNKVQQDGWITAEYGLLPRSTGTRTSREATRGKVSGRTSEIMRLIGRSLRSVVDLTAIPDKTITIDCDVIQADGGTRTASITGAFVAMVDALNYLKDQNVIKTRPVKSYMAAVSAGMVNGEDLLDLTYEEDSQAQMDMNVVMTSSGDIIEIQGTAEKNPVTKKEFYRLVDVAHKGVKELIVAQKEVLKGVMGIVWPDKV